jgi:hypothetical protein
MADRLPRGYAQSIVLQTVAGDAAAKGGKRKGNPIDPANPVR